MCREVHVCRHWISKYFKMKISRWTMAASPNECDEFLPLLRIGRSKTVTIPFMRPVCRYSLVCRNPYAQYPVPWSMYRNDQVHQWIVCQWTTESRRCGRVVMTIWNPSFNISLSRYKWPVIHEHCKSDVYHDFWKVMRTRYIFKPSSGRYCIMFGCFGGRHRISNAPEIGKYDVMSMLLILKINASNDC